MRTPYSAKLRPVTKLVPTRPRQAREGHYVIERPLLIRPDGEEAPGSHWRRASCEEMRCPHYLHGWDMIVPTDSVQAYYVIHDSGREFTEERVEGGQTRFHFPPGQTCFGATDHWRPKGMPELFTASGQLHENSRDWKENHNEVLYQLRRTVERG